MNGLTGSPAHSPQPRERCPPRRLLLSAIAVLVEANDYGSFTVVVDGLNEPTSLEFIGDAAYVVTLGGEIWRIEHVVK